MSVVIATKKLIQIRRSSILKKNVSILSSSRIIRPFTKSDYINNHIPSTSLNFFKDGKFYVVSFLDDNYLTNLKKHMYHPYPISRLPINELLLHLHKADNLVIISNRNTSLSMQHYAFLIDANDLRSHDECISISVHKLEF